MSCYSRGEFDYTKTSRKVSLYRMNRRVQIIAGCVVFAAILAIVARTRTSGTSASVQVQRLPTTGTPVVLTPPTDSGQICKVVVSLPKTATNSPSTGTQPKDP